MIHYTPEQQLFNLHTQNSTYQLKVIDHHFLAHLYYGSRLDGSDVSYILPQIEKAFGLNPSEVGLNRVLTLDTLPQEYPTYGMGDNRAVAATVQDEKGCHILDLRYQDHKITKGKYSLQGLPSLYAEKDEEAETLEITLVDEVAKITVTLLYGVFYDKDVITRATLFKNEGNHKVYLKKTQSANIDIRDGQYDLIHFHGGHAFEQQFERNPITHTKQTLGSGRGTSSHQHNPGFIVAEEGTTEEVGRCYGFNLVYSGNFNATVMQTVFGQTRINWGLGDEVMHYPLNVGETFTTPEAVMSYSSQGLARLSHQFHKVVRHNVCRGQHKLTKRPVVINNWEATYFNFNGQKLREIAQCAKKLGADTFVLDDGWFGDRSNDEKALGDWFVNEEKLGGSLAGLSADIHTMGLNFGLWIEPEMVNEESKLYKAHPDWAFCLPGRKSLRGRNQLVLDIGREEVRSYIFNTIAEVVDKVKVDYIKWDMNRSIADWYDPALSPSQMGIIQHRYVLGLYQLMEMFNQRYPQILFEGCSGGGGRFDLGVLSYQPQFWTSDNTDALYRLKIQYGTSFFYPLSTMGSHISAVPNHQTGRVTSLKTRAVVAMAGSFGYELDVTAMSEAELAEAKTYTDLFNGYRSLIHNGLYYRLSSPFKNRLTAWQIASEDQKEALISLVFTDIIADAQAIFLKLNGLNPTATYRLKGGHFDGQQLTGKVLSEVGLKILITGGDWQTEQIYLSMV